MDKIIKDGKAIAKIILETDTEFRGNLLSQVSKNLELFSNFFTAKVLQNAAENYGIKK